MTCKSSVSYACTYSMRSAEAKEQGDDSKTALVVVPELYEARRA
jgi:hypothetical protein